MLMVVAATAVRGGESLTVLSSPVATMTAGTPTVSRPSVGSSTPTSGSSEVGTTADTDAPSTVESTTGTPPSSTDTVATPTSQPWADIVPLVLRGFAMSVIIVAAVLGNILVIISVVRHRKLRIITNYFVVSLALADLLVALCAMTFNASVELTGRWLFGSVMCDVWNSLDVYFSTASILHLCCISVDRYYAIVRPLEYPLCMTRRTVVLMLSQVWLLPALISFTPIFLGWYTTTEHSEFRKLHPHICAFVVNRAYAVVSSSVSFWIPGIVMITMYFRIYKEAIRQKRALSRTSSHILLNSVVAHHSSSGAGGASAAAAALQQYQQALQRHRSLHVGSMQFPPLQKPVDSTCCCNNARQVHEQPFENVQVVTVETENELPPKSHGVAAVNAAADLNVNGLNPRGVPMSAQQQQTSWRTEHKAARTLGVIMGAFLLCWLPFFLWYVTTSLCGEACHCPDLLVSVLFWIGSKVAAALLNKHLQINGIAAGLNVGNGLRSTDGSKEDVDEPRRRSVGDAGETPKMRRKKRQLGVKGAGSRVGALSEGQPAPGEELMAASSTSDAMQPIAASKMKRERKAARTLGIIMSAFLVCWLPFFLWYLSTTLCGEACHCPPIVVAVVFWIGYFNSALNPIIYAYFNREFRVAFKKTLLSCFSCAEGVAMEGIGRDRVQRRLEAGRHILGLLLGGSTCCRSLTRKGDVGGNGVKPSCAENTVRVKSSDAGVVGCLSGRQRESAGSSDNQGADQRSQNVSDAEPMDHDPVI